MTLNFRLLSKRLLYLVYIVVLLVLLEIFFFQKFVGTKYYIDHYTFNDDASWRLRWVFNHKRGTDPSFGADLYDPVRGWTLKPNLDRDNYVGSKKLASNSKGLRGKKEFTYERNEKPRILIFGDSFTFGDEVSDDETYAHILSELRPDVEV